MTCCVRAHTATVDYELDVIDRSIISSSRIWRASLKDNKNLFAFKFWIIISRMKEERLNNSQEPMRASSVPCSSLIAHVPLVLILWLIFLCRIYPPAMNVYRSSITMIQFIQLTWTRSILITNSQHRIWTNVGCFGALTHRRRALRTTKFTLARTQPVERISYATWVRSNFIQRMNGNSLSRGGSAWRTKKGSREY